MSRKRFFASLAKVEEQDDGTLIVYGYASTESEDADGEVIKADAMRAALPGYMKWGAVREMHQPKAAGTAIEAEVRDDGTTWFGARVVDDDAIKKVKAGVYKGFSVGGNVTGRDPENRSVITGIDLIEVSLVDRPANPEAVITMYKAQDAAARAAVDELATMLDNAEVDAEQLLALAKASAAIRKAAGASNGTADDATQGEGGESVQKGLYTVSRFADVLESVASMCRDVDYEAQYEGDNSPLPAQMREWLKAGTVIFQTMTVEEIDELLAATAGSDQVVEVIEAAADSGDTQKGEGPPDAEDEDAEKDDHEADEDAEKSDDADEPAGEGDEDEDGDDDADKAAAPASLGKRLRRQDDDDLRKMVGEMAELLKAQQAEIAALKAQPAPAKGVLRVVEKGAEVSGDGDGELKIDPVRKADGTIDEAATLMKAVHGFGGRRVFPVA